MIKKYLITGLLLWIGSISYAQMMLPAYQGVFSRKIIASGVAGNGLDFDGVDDYVQNTSFNGYLTGNVDHTVEFWVNYKGGQTGDRWIAWYGDSGALNKQEVIGFDGATGKIKIHHVSTNNDKLSITAAIPVNTWAHVAIAYTGSSKTAAIYLNGNYIESIIFTNDLELPINGKLQIGTYSSYANLFASNIILDDFRIWNVARTQPQIQANMNKELLGTEAGLVAYYPFNQGIAAGNNTAITTVTDKTANARNGALTNFAKTGATSNFVVGKVESSVITDGLVLNLDAGNTASYPGSGTVWADLSGNINNATLVNGVAYNSANGGSLVFDGADDYADITSTSLGSATVLTIEGFVKWVSGTGGMFFGFTTYDVWTQSGTLGYNNGGSNVIGISAAKVSSLNLIGNWHHYTFIMKSSGLLSTNKIYIDGVDMGVLTPVVANDGNIPGFNNNLRLCSWNNGAFNGNMQYANLRIYNRELTVSEINQNYNASKARFGL